MSTVKKNEGFNPKTFSQPDSEFYPGYFWMWDVPLKLDELLDTLHDMYNHNARSICIHPSPKGWSKTSEAEPDYMSREYLEILRGVAEEADRLGMNNYFYDEGGFPSGTALGTVVPSDPKHLSRQFYNYDKKTRTFTLFTESANNRNDEYTRPNYPNLMASGSGKRFTEMAHDKLKTVLGPYLGKSIHYTFTDEPVLPTLKTGEQLGWCDDFGEEFLKRKNYRIEPFLYDIIRRPAVNEPKEVRQHRIDYCDVRSQLFTERYVYALRDWARKNNIASGGHYGGEDCPEGNLVYGYGHIMRALRGMDLPGVDVIWRQIYPRTKLGSHRNLYAIKRKHDPICTDPRNVPFTKYASSTAHQSGRNKVLCECFAVYGAGLMPQPMRFIIDHQLLRGATNFVWSNYPQEYKGMRLAIGCRPQFGRCHLFWDWYTGLHAYVARMGSILSQGKSGANTLFYYDVPSIWCGGKTMYAAIDEHFRASEELLKHHVDFDFVDDDALVSGKIEGKQFKIGVMNYDTIVIPPENHMFPEAMAQVEEFRRRGGRVLTTREISRIEPIMKFAGDSDSLRVVKRVSGAETLYFITNEDERTVSSKLIFAEEGPVQFYNGWNGKRYQLKKTGTSLNWVFPPFGSALFVINSAIKADESYRSFKGGKELIRLEEGWTLQPTRQYVYDKEEYRIEELNVPAKSVKLGDWRAYLGKWFSGEGKYRIVFNAHAGKTAQLDLGQINYVSRVFLNGRKIGETFAEPGRFILNNLKEGANVLEVYVTNTQANAILDPATVDYWDKNFPWSIYQSINRLFEKEALPSGLFGPVTLQYGKLE